MKLTLKRHTFLEDRTISDLYVNDVFYCNVLEDKDRGLMSSMPLSEIESKKVYGQTAIPYGRYTVIISYSNRFKTYLPLLSNVPGYLGIRIHSGNTPEHTHGCLLPGIWDKKTNTVKRSIKTFNSLFSLLKKVEKKEKIEIELVSNN